MTDLIRRFRGMGIAVVVLALSAGVVFAGAPRLAPVSDETLPPVEEPSGDAASDAPADDPSVAAPDPSDDVDEPSNDASDDAGKAGEADPSAGTHGALVSEAARMETPGGFRNHGAFLSCVAKMDKEVEAASIDWTAVTPESCGQASADADPTASAQAGSEKADKAGRVDKAGKAKDAASRGSGKGKAGH